MSNQSMVNYYDVLGLAPNATQSDVGAAYRRAMRRVHPDTASDGGDLAAATLLNEAHAVLADPDARADYDRSLQQRTPDQPSYRQRTHPRPRRDGRNQSDAPPVSPIAHKGDTRPMVRFGFLVGGIALTFAPIIPVLWSAESRLGTALWLLITAFRAAMTIARFRSGTAGLLSTAVLWAASWAAAASILMVGTDMDAMLVVRLIAEYVGFWTLAFAGVSLAGSVLIRRYLQRRWLFFQTKAEAKQWVAFVERAGRVSNPRVYLITQAAPTDEGHRTLVLLYSVSADATSQATSWGTHAPGKWVSLDAHGVVVDSMRDNARESWLTLASYPDAKHRWLHY